MDKVTLNPDLTVPEAFKWRIPINWDPVPWWFFERVKLPTEGLAQLAVIHLESQRAMLQQQMKTIEQSIEVVSKFSGK